LWLRIESAVLAPGVRSVECMSASAQVEEQLTTRRLELPNEF